MWRTGRASLGLFAFGSLSPTIAGSATGRSLEIEGRIRAGGRDPRGRGSDRRMAGIDPAVPAGAAPGKPAACAGAVPLEARRLKSASTPATPELIIATRMNAQACPGHLPVAPASTSRSGRLRRSRSNRGRAITNAARGHEDQRRPTTRHPRHPLRAPSVRSQPGNRAARLSRGLLAGRLTPRLVEPVLQHLLRVARSLALR